MQYAAEYMSLSREEGYVWGAIRTAMASVSDTCVVQLQDYLDLGGEARMNFPGTRTSDNWTWRAEAGFDSDKLAQRIVKLTKLYGRLAEKENKSTNTLYRKFPAFCYGKCRQICGG